MAFFKRGVFFLLFFLLFSCKSEEKDEDLFKMFGSISEVEDNNSFEKANLVSIEKPILGFLSYHEAGNDCDYYKIEASEKEVSYEMVFSPIPDVDSKITFYDDRKKVLFTLDENGVGEGEKLWEFSFYSEEAYLKVESKIGSNSFNPYVINFTKKTANYSEIEPNNSEKEAIEIRLNETKEAFISPRNDIDYYKTVFDQDGIYDFWVEIETLSNLDVNFIVIEKNTNMIKTINSEGFGGSEISPYLSSNKGEYFIKVSSKINTSDKKPPIYYISLKEQKSKIDDTEYLYEREINDVSEFATELINNVEILGNLYPENDVDWYTFSLHKDPISADMTVSETKGVDFKLEFYQNDKTLFKTVNDNANDKGEQISIKDIKRGKYYLKVSGS
ncbi:MAG TPA: hypothetical protein PLO89_10560, partial [Spirochaetota bacterium]|nr:hypothetical protein [Spirochaetota bacterium]